MDYAKRYAGFLRKHLAPKRDMKVVFDCSNGTTGIVLPELFRKFKNQNSNFKINPIFINRKPDGNFPAHGPNPLAPGAADQLEKRVKKQKADLGVIFDADGDRVFFVDDRGRLVDAHEIGFALMQMSKAPFVVSSIASWRLKKLKAQSSKLKAVFISPVGHYFFKNVMRAKKASLGLEHSGHFYFRDFFYCDSGILAAVMMINFVSGLKNGLAAWVDALPEYYRSGELNFKTDKKEEILKNIRRQYAPSAKKISTLDGLTMEFGSPSTGASTELSRMSSGQNAGAFWFNVRPSNTENLLRLNVEATDKKVLEKQLQNLKKLITV